MITGDASLDWLLRGRCATRSTRVPFATIGTLIWMLIAYRFHQSLIDAVTGGHEVTRKEEPRLYNLLENLCISRGITMPKLKMMETRRSTRSPPASTKSNTRSRSPPGCWSGSTTPRSKRCSATS